jgi:hypothetical protein
MFIAWLRYELNAVAKCVWQWRFLCVIPISGYF